MQRKSRSPLLLMALTILIDFIGFGLIIPLLPFWAEHVGATPVGVGLILTVYAIAQFVCTPLLGSLSDRYGRKPVIVASLILETCSFVLTALAGNLPLLLCARFLGGIGASNIGSAQAVVADVTDAKNRASGMGMIGASIGLGFVIGPLLGGILAPLGTTLPFWVAGGLALINALLVILFLPETRQQRTGSAVRQNLLRGWGSVLHTPAILTLISVNLLFTLAFTAMEAVFSLFSQKTFGWGASQNGYIFTYIGIIIVLMQGGLVGQLVKRWNERGVMLVGLLLLAVGLIMLAFSQQFALLLVSLALLSIGEGAVTPTVSTLLSFASSQEKQGEILGLSQGLAGLGRAVGPVAAGLAYMFYPGTPFIIGGILVLLAFLVAVSNRSHLHQPVHLMGGERIPVGGEISH
ncbi:MFS transporter [Tengunoibacter tsumagoiensis]|uniref:Tetracycline resistance MFS efflux pump n=1 Tax=Tengunoibacter tsumagoiensis TaxID=2014871 RepID=A0A402A4D7_9CHLR|nr:MFS transporter [Tengunoibacter tsumagoiensis]GCE14003.1 tetracycline resistance MFS efflux pump [Tengunoibacter tsumagoiensis]